MESFLRKQQHKNEKEFKDLLFTTNQKNEFLF